MQYNNYTKVSTIFLVFLSFLFYQAYGQQVASSQDSSAQTPAWADDSLGRRTPRGAVQGFIRAVAQENYGRASLYLNVPKALRKKVSGEELAKALQQLLDYRGNIFPYSLISNRTEGDINDDLANNLDIVGSARNNDSTFNILVERTEEGSGAPLWLFANQTLENVPLSLEGEIQTPQTFIERTFPDALGETRWRGVPISHWITMFFLVLLSLAIAWAVIKIILTIIPFVWKKASVPPTPNVIKAFSLPVQLYTSVLLFISLSEKAGVSIVVRQRFGDITVVVGLIAFFLLLWQLVDVITTFFERRMIRGKNQAAVSAILFFRRASKIAVVIIGVIMILNTFGVDVTTGIAALGIGGLALALGAQKTVENFVGSVTLIADQPIRVGDFCKVGDIVGTVESIGMRSTHIRTLNRTIVTIPNGEFSSLKIENFAHRERFWFHPVFNLPYETTPDQVRYLLVELRSVLYAHSLVDPAPARIRFVDISRDAFQLEVFAYVNSKDFDQFLEVQEDLYLRMLDVIASSGTRLARPAQTIHMAKDKEFSKEKADEIQQIVKEWRETDDLQIPNFDPDKIQNLKNTIPFPPEGSISRKGGK